MADPARAAELVQKVTSWLQLGGTPAAGDAAALALVAPAVEAWVDGLPGIDRDTMHRTLLATLAQWRWEVKIWGWDYPMTAMNATRLGEPEKAVGALLMDKRTNTYLLNGHNYQDGRLRCYLPGNGGLLTAVALMCAGWDGCEVKNPGFPQDGTWDVRWEGLKPMP